MTYLGFHLRFNLPLLLVTAFLAGPSFFQPESLLATLGVLLAVFAFTIPWDNYAAARGIWGFPKGRYARLWGYLPVEEYLFFLLQSLEAIWLTRFVSRLWPTLESIQPLPRLGDALPTLAILGAGWAVVGIGLGRRITPRFHYAWHLLFWFLPVIAAQWVIGWQILLPRIPILLAVCLTLGTLLSLADHIAIHHGVWWVDPKQTTGHRIGPALPWEEAAFFYLTSLLVSQSYLLMLPEALR